MNYGVIAVFISSLLLTLSCSTHSVNRDDPEAMLKDAEEEIQGDHYLLALDKLKAIKNKFPYSKVAAEAHLRIADVYFMQESYVEAASTYESFRDLHPKHEKTAYAMFRIGKSYYNDIPSNIARDLASAQHGLESYQLFLKQFPNSADSPEATKDVIRIRELLARKELSIGDFYFKRDYPNSAKPRYNKVLIQYPETEAAQKAQEHLKEIEAQEK